MEGKPLSATWVPLSGGDPHLLIGHSRGITAIAISPDGRWVATGSADRTIRVWPMPDVSQPPLHTLPHEDLLDKLRSLTNLAVVPDEESSTGWKVKSAPFQAGRRYLHGEIKRDFLRWTRLFEAEPARTAANRKLPEIRMRNPHSILRLLVAALALLPPGVRADTTGQLRGSVSDEQGTPLPGVAVSASSPAQIGGAQLASTDARGEFRYPLLAPGDYVVRLSLDGFVTQELTEVRIRLEHATQLQVTMAEATFEEEIVVAETTPVVDPEQTSAGRVHRRVPGEVLHRYGESQLPLRSRTNRRCATKRLR